MTNIEQFQKDELTKLFVKYGCDKQKHGYHRAYQALFKRIRGDVKNVLEVGIGSADVMADYALDHYEPGGSLRVWRDYFTRAQIYGFDIDPDTLFEEDRVSTFLVDSTKEPDVKAWMSQFPDLCFDIVIDDGSHEMEDQLETFRFWFPCVSEGGFYIVEDIWNEEKLVSAVTSEIFNMSGGCCQFLVLGDLNSNMLVVSK